MGKKTIYLSPTQINEMVGQSGYLNKSSNGSLPSYTSTETKTDGDYSEDKIALSDRIAHSLSTTGLGNRRTGLYCSKSSKKKIFEGGNSEINGKIYTLPDNLISHFQSLKSQYADFKGKAGHDTMEFVTDNGQINGNHAYRLQNRLNKADKNSDEYKMLGGDEMLNFLNNILQRDASLSRKQKEFKSEMGIENAFIKSHEKNTGGKAHSDKQNETNGVIAKKYEK
jgi:hypothetical protein